MKRIDVAKALPFVFLLAYQIHNGTMASFLSRALGSEHAVLSVKHVPKEPRLIGTIPACFISIAIAFSLVTVSMFIAQYMGWGYFKIEEDIGNLSTIREYLMMIPEFFCIVAEEMVVRCYLLPMMMSQYTTGHAIALSGCIWGLYTVPLTLLLHEGDCETTWSGHRLFLSSLLTPYPYSWVAVKSGYVCWAPSILHFVNKSLSSFALGNMETKELGIMKGEPWKTNGLTNIITAIPFAFFTTFELNTLSHLS
ncbi:uncharacterized protein LOC117106893 [Anneissia japonica]|uniref:uncharacterized protein LOC117106893 n=1 Tax=Anneissia japonica TaxID=1529436 RepID=UPI0014255FD4|nr:uncharacterized protein LOC117106893 [Anneissia japonica]